jgi:DNA-binding beta-propeller fold protein YncE
MQATETRTSLFKIMPSKGLVRALGPVLIASLLFAVGASEALAQVVKASFPTTPGVFGMAINPATNTVYIVSFPSNLVTVINGSTFQTTTVNVGAGPVAVDVDTATNRIFVANRTGSSVTVIDGVTNATSTIALHGTPASLAVDSVTHKVWVPVDTFKGSYTYGAVELVDEATGSVVDIDKGILPALLEAAIDSVHNKLYVANSVQSILTVTEVDGSNNSFENISDVTGNLAVDTGTNQVFVANPMNGLIDIDASTYRSFTAAGADTSYTAVAVNETTHKVYASGNGLTILDEASGAATDVSLPSAAAANIAIDTTSNMVFVSSYTSPGILSVVDGSTNAVTSLSVAPLVSNMVINPNTGLLYLVSNDAVGTVTVVDGRAGTTGPIFTVQPISQTVNSGALVALSALGVGAAPVFHWSINGTPLADGAGVSGSSTPSLYLSNVSAASAGSYTCTISDTRGTMTSNPAVLTVVSSASPGHLVNLSCRGFVGLDGYSEQSALIAGFVVGGHGAKSVVLRGVGPGLAAFAVDGAPSLSLSLLDAAPTPNLISSDSAWQSPPTAPTGPWVGRVSPVDATPSDFQQVGAFALASGSADTALKATLPAGAYTSEIAAPSGGAYLALAEVYDADPSGSGTVLINLSARAYTAGGQQAMIAGFVISGSTSQTVLIRASGPALTSLGVENVLPQPQLTLFNSALIAVASNTGWQGSAEIAQVASNVGAFAWNDPRSADAALLITLPPGSYTAQVTGTSMAGTALVEVYAVP